jgi:hypothetical protein
VDRHCGGGQQNPLKTYQLTVFFSRAEKPLGILYASAFISDEYERVKWNLL